MKNLEGKVAVVTGAGSGIGRAIACALAARGCVLALVDVNQSSLESVRTEITAAGVDASRHIADVSSEAAMKALVEEVVAQHGRVNILVNNAGVVALGRFEESSLEDFRWVGGINAWGVIHGCKYFLPHVPPGDGHVVNIVSAAGIYAEPGRSAYAFTKFGIRGFTEALRLELADRGVGVSAVYPGIIKTNISAATRHAGERPADHHADPLGGRAHPPELVAKKVVYAVERNKARVLVGAETYALDIGSRLMPTLFPRLIRWITGAHLA